MGRYGDQTVTSASALKRFSHSSRFDLAAALLDIRPNERVLDYGAGEGHFLHRLAELGRASSMVGYEPAPRVFEELSTHLNAEIEGGSVQVFRDPDELVPAFDKVACLEVLEHLPEQLQRDALRRMRKLLKDDGSIIVSVPIEVGLSSLAKNIARTMIGETHSGTSVTNVIRTLFHGRVDRPSSDYMHSHIGFHYRDLEAVFRDEGLDVRKSVCSPLRPMGRVLNSQVLYVLGKRPNDG